MATVKRYADGEETVRHVSIRARRKAERPKPAMQPPLTPMIDVVFQLLLFFLVATRFINLEAQIQAKLPEMTKDVVITPKFEPIRISLTKSGSSGVMIVVEEVIEPIANMEQLLGFLKGRNRKFPEPETDTGVIIKPSADVAWDHAVNAFSQAVIAKFEKVAFQKSE